MIVTLTEKSSQKNRIYYHRHGPWPKINKMPFKGNVNQEKLIKTNSGIIPVVDLINLRCEPNETVLELFKSEEMFAIMQKHVPPAFLIHLHFTMSKQIMKTYDPTFLSSKCQALYTSCVAQRVNSYAIHIAFGIHLCKHTKFYGQRHFTGEEGEKKAAANNKRRFSNKHNISTLKCFYV